MWCKTLIFVNFFIIGVFGEVVIKAGEVSSQGHEQEQNGGVYDGIVKTGVTNFEDKKGFDENNEKKIVQAQDEGKYDEDTSAKKVEENNSGYAGEKFHQKGGGTVTDFGAKTGHKKGHHRAGFRNTYHKDESGSNTSFYDDAEDAGDQLIRHSEKGAYGDTEQHQNHGAHSEGNAYSKDEGKHGGYNNAGTYHHDTGNQNNYGQHQHYADNTVHGKSNIGNQYNEAGYHNVEKYHARPPLLVHSRPYHGHHDYHLPPPPLPHHPVSLPAKKTITIYEDPRISYGKHNRYEDPVYSDDYIQLDVRRSPPPRPYYKDYKNYERYPSYDDYYYY